MKIQLLLLFIVFFASCAEVNYDERPREPISEREEISLIIEHQSIIVKSKGNLWERKFSIDESGGTQPLLHPTFLVVKESNSFYFNLFNKRLLALDKNSGELIGDFSIQNIPFGVNDTIPHFKHIGSDIVFATERKAYVFNDDLSLEMDILKRIESLELHEIGAYLGDTIDIMNIPSHVIKSNLFFSDD